MALAASAVLSVPSAAAAAPWSAVARASVPATVQNGGTAPPMSAEAQQAAHLVERMRERASEVAAQLVDGTRRWEDGQAELGRRQAAAVAAQRTAESSVDEVESADAAVREIIAARYRNPVPAGLVLLLAPPGDSPTDAVAGRAVLAEVQSKDDETLDRATAARARAEQDVTHVQQDALETAALVQQQERELTALRQLALRTAEELQAADRELRAVRRTDARSWQAQELRKAQAAQRARLRAAAAAARRRAADAAAVGTAARPTTSTAAGPISTGGAACSAPSTEGYANGFVDGAALCPLYGAPGHRLQRDAALAFSAMSRAREAETGQPLCVTDSYRSYSAQVRLFAEKPSLAAIPGTSNHGWGLAVDLCGGVQSFGAEAHTWMQRNAGRFGWVHPAWAEQGGSRPEPWHWEFGDL